MADLTEPLATNISKAKVLLLRRFPFLGYIALSAPIHETHQLSIAGASATAVYINPEHFNKMSLKDQAQVLAHEVLHLAFRHFPRRKWRSKLKWNVAADIMVNDVVSKQGFTLTSGTLTIDRVFSNPEDVPPMDELTAEIVYSMLPDESVMMQLLKDELPLDDLVEDENGVSREENANWEFIVKAAAKHSNAAYGAMPGWLQRHIGLTKPEFNWVTIMSYFVGSMSRQERSYRRLSKRHLWRNAIIPKDSQHDTNLVVVIDASASITSDMLNLFVSEVNNISITLGKPFRAMVHDVAITLDTIIRPGMYRITSVKGGGGTHFVPVIEELKKDPPDGVIWFTDGYGLYSEERPDFPILWILTRRHLEPPYGWTAVMRTV